MHSSPLVAPSTGPFVSSLPPDPAADTRFARVPVLLAVAFLGLLLLPRVQSEPHLFATHLAIGSGLVVWQLLLWATARRSGRRLLVVPVPPVRQHYVQACVQCGLYAYWGYHWRPIYDQLPLILGQLAFVFAFDALLSWTRGRPWRFGSGPLPVVLSTNLFIWFVDGWYGLQFVMIVVGLLGKEFLRWNKDGRRAHIFNPSGFGLLVAAIALIASGATDEITMARPLATTIDGPDHIYLVLFGLGLVVQGFFGVTLMTFFGVVASTLAAMAYHATTGSYLFAASNLPAAGFLGMHLLMTDPATSPRTNLGRAIFGTGYGLLYVFFYDLLGPLGDLEIYAKLFPVPLLNLTVLALDRFARTGAIGRLNHRWENFTTPVRMNAIHMAVWIAVFGTMLGTGYLSRPHPAASVAFWKHAYSEGKPQAGRKLAMIALGEASGESYNEMGILSTDPAFLAIKGAGERLPAEHWFAQSASMRNLDGCRNLVLHYVLHGGAQGPVLGFALQGIAHDAEKNPAGASALVLALALEAGRGQKKDTGRALQMFRARPDDPIARKGIARIALQTGGEFVDVNAILEPLQREADAGDAESCWYLAYLVAYGRGGKPDPERARALLQRACDLGLPAACEALKATALPPFAPLDADHTARPAWSTSVPT
ncbi:MAG: SEL1-like repeat protein [Planctomycetes bacterium]|nr:SEL1-like repeat protein [Planctomycetota bacterium]